MTFILRRLVQAIPVIILASIPIFMILHAAPGDPALMLAGEDASDAQIEAVRRNLGLDRPLVEQYVTWLRDLVTGDLGRSFISGLPVSRLIIQRLPATIELAVTAMILSVLISVPLGAWAAVSRGKTVDRLITVGTTFGIAVPNFWIAILLVLLFGLTLRLLPAGGYVSILDDPLRGFVYLILPAGTLAISLSANLARFVRASMLEVLPQDYIRTARSKGLRSGLVIYRHALRNSLIPMLTVLGVQFGRLLAGSIIIESIFTWPGIGNLMLTAIRSRDFPVIQGTLAFFMLIVILTNLFTDMMYGAVDPRIRLRGR
ncbi:MAG: ABC transporter permease [Trueperaceae bacterium]